MSLKFALPRILQLLKAVILQLLRRMTYVFFDCTRRFFKIYFRWRKRSVDLLITYKTIVISQNLKLNNGPCCNQEFGAVAEKKVFFFNDPFLLTPFNFEFGMDMNRFYTPSLSNF